MAVERIRSGRMVEVDEPDWEPLKQAALTGLVGSFMWMFAVELGGGGRLHAYKHRDTRRYLHLDERAGAWIYEGDERYREVELEHALAAALATWWRGVDLSLERRLGIGS